MSGLSRFSCQQFAHVAWYANLVCEARFKWRVIQYGIDDISPPPIFLFLFAFFFILLPSTQSLSLVPFLDRTNEARLKNREIIARIQRDQINKESLVSRSLDFFYQKLFSLLYDIIDNYNRAL